MESQQPHCSDRNSKGKHGEADGCGQKAGIGAPQKERAGSETAERNRKETATGNSGLVRGRVTPQDRGTPEVATTLWQELGTSHLYTTLASDQDHISLPCWISGTHQKQASWNKLRLIPPDGV